MQQLNALLRKRVQSTPRDLRAFLFVLLIPLLLVAAAVAIGKLVNQNVTWYEQNVAPLPFMALPAGSLMASQGSAYALLASTFYEQDPTMITEIPFNISARDYLLEYPFHFIIF